jgi:UrcA family protein
MKIHRSKQVQAIQVAVGAAILSASLLTAARAAEDPAPGKVVSYADLNILTPAGAKVLYQRIQWAARQVCPPDNFHDLAVWHARQCIQKSVDEAVKTVHSPALSALHSQNVIRLARN